MRSPSLLCVIGLAQCRQIAKDFQRLIDVGLETVQSINMGFAIIHAQVEAPGLDDKNYRPPLPCNCRFSL
jgi:hypothetical protein